MSVIDDLRNRVIELRGQLLAAEKNYKRALVEESPYRIGDVYEHVDGRRGKIVGINFDISYGAPTIRPQLTFYKKDGTLGARTQEIWSWNRDKWKLISREDAAHD